MFIGKFTSFFRRYSRFLAIACLLAVAVPAGIAISTDFAQAAAAGGGGGRGGGGGGKGGGGGGGGDDTRECASGACLVITECRGGDCGPPPPSTCIGAACSSVPETRRVSYVQTVVGCKVKTCNISRNKMSCITKKAADAKLCEKNG